MGGGGEEGGEGREGVRAVLIYNFFERHGAGR